MFCFVMGAIQIYYDDEGISRSGQVFITSSWFQPLMYLKSAGQWLSELTIVNDVVLCAVITRRKLSTFCCWTASSATRVKMMRRTSKPSRNVVTILVCYYLWDYICFFFFISVSHWSTMSLSLDVSVFFDLCCVRCCSDIKSYICNVIFDVICPSFWLSSFIPSPFYMAVYCSCWQSYSVHSCKMAKPCQLLL